MRLFATRTQNKRKQKSVKTFTHKTLARVPKFDHYDIKRLTWPLKLLWMAFMKREFICIHIPKSCCLFQLDLPKNTVTH